jgi:hypothetical protein
MSRILFASANVRKPNIYMAWDQLEVWSGDYACCVCLAQHYGIVNEINVALRGSAANGKWSFMLSNICHQIKREPLFIKTSPSY